jgi:nucleoside-diphosphate-sugar epimerase
MSNNVITAPTNAATDPTANASASIENGTETGTETGTVLILGASGKIGHHASRAFAAAGWKVRHYDRAAGDMSAAAQGADVIVNGLNPPAYHNWAVLIPQITAQVIAAAKASGATVILPGNVYNFGTAPGPWSEQTPQRPNSKKGRIRVEMEQAYAASGVQTVVLRAGDFIAPGHDDVMSLVLMRSIASGKLTSPGDAEAMHAFCYVPDWARAAVALMEMRHGLGRFEDVPFAGHSLSVSTLKRGLESVSGRKVRLSNFPWWLISLTSPVWEMARELREMRYLWSLPHQLSGVRFAQLLPQFKTTPLREVLSACLPEEMRQAEGLAQDAAPLATATQPGRS